jgi:hypothetical protein
VTDVPIRDSGVSFDFGDARKISTKLRTCMNQKGIFHKKTGVAIAQSSRPLNDYSDKDEITFRIKSLCHNSNGYMI